MFSKVLRIDASGEESTQGEGLSRLKGSLSPRSQHLPLHMAHGSLRTSLAGLREITS